MARSAGIGGVTATQSAGAANWARILSGGLKDVGTRLSPEQGALINRLPDDDAKAGALTKSWAKFAYPQMDPRDIDANWDTVRPLIAKNFFGVDDPRMTNTAFYGLVAKHTQDEQGFRATLPQQLAGMPTAVARNMVDWFNKPAVELPEAPKDVPDMGTMGYDNPAIWAGVYNGAVRPLLQTLETPSTATFLVGGAEIKAASEIYPMAKVALAGVSGLFGYMMGSEAIRTAPEVRRVFADPNASTQQKSEVVAREVYQAGLGLLGAFGTVEELGGARDLEGHLKGKTPPEAVQEIRVQALTAKKPNQAEALSAAADKLEEVAGLRTPGEPPASSGEGLGWFEEGTNPAQPPGTTPLTLNPKVELITAAAIRTKDGVVREGPSHQWIRANFDGTADGDEGFVTSTRRFVDRTEAGEIAKATGQALPDVKELHAEDMPRVAEKPIAKPEPTEPVNPVKETSLKNAVADLERKGYGLEEANPQETRAMADSWVRSATALERDPNAGCSRLAAELLKNPNIGLTDDQSALLLRHKVGIENALNDAIELASDNDQSPELRGEAERQAKALSNELQDFLNAVHTRGSEWGREGRWRQAMAKEDYSFAAQERLMRVAKGGGELTDDERDTLNRQLAAIRAKNAELEAHVEMLRRQVTPEQAADRAVRQLAKPPTRPRAPSVANRLRQSLKDRAQKAREELAGRLLTPGPKDIYNLSVITADWVVENGIEAAKWSAEMIGQFGEKIRPILAEAWEKGLKLFHVETRSALLEDFRSKGSPELKPDVGPLAQELARSFISEGIRDREALVDAVHAQLKDIAPSITRREAMDAISGYGKFKPLTHDEVTDRLRDLKGQLQQVSKLDDMEAGQAPKKTGMERAEPSDEQRQLIQQVEAKKKEGGYAVTDRATQLRTALDAVKTNLRNRIADLEKQISTRERIVSKKGVVPYDQEALALKARRDELRDEFEQLFKEDDQAARNKTQRDALQKKIDTLQAKNEAGDTRPAGVKMSRPALPHLEPLRQELDRLHDEMAELRKSAEVPLEKRLYQWKARATARIEDLEGKLKTGDIMPAAKKPPIALDAEGIRDQPAARAPQGGYSRATRDRQGGHEAQVAATPRVQRGLRARHGDLRLPYARQDHRLLGAADRRRDAPQGGGRGNHPENARL